MAETGQRIDPYHVFRFLVEIGGVTYGMFRECSGFGSEVAAVENPQGGAQYTMKVAARVKFPNIVLKYGLTDDRELYDWHLAAVEGNIQRRNGSIILCDSQGQEKVRWNFFGAWPSKWDGADFNAGSDEIAVETLELTVERCVRA